MTAPTNQDGLYQRDVQEILRVCAQRVGASPITAELRQKYVDEIGRILADPANKARTKIEAIKLAAILDANNRQLLELADKINRLDNGQATERTETLTIIIDEHRSPDPVPQTD